MADLTSLSQTATDGDRVMSAWLNAVRSRFEAIEAEVDSAIAAIALINSSLSPLRVESVSGNTIRVLAGAVKLQATGQVASVPTQTLAVANGTTYIYVGLDGTVNQSLNVRPTGGLELAKVSASGGLVLAIVNYPLQVSQVAPDLSLYATMEYARSQQWEDVAYGKRTTSMAIPTTGNYYTVPFDAISGAGLNTSGIFTHSGAAREYSFHAQVRIDTTSVLTYPDLSGKISIAVSGQGELGIALVQAESARGDLVLNAQTARPVVMNDGDTARLQIYITQGTNTRVREESRLQIWRLPSD